MNREVTWLVHTLLLACVCWHGMAPATSAVILRDPHWDSNTTAPADDPGWFNIPSNRSGIYLGDQRYLTARHAVAFNPGQPNDGLPNIVLDGHTFSPVAGTAQVLTNPGGMGLSTNTDLIMWTIDTAVDPSNASNPFYGRPEDLIPDLKEITISTETVPLGGMVTMVGRGNDRARSTTDHWTVDMNPDGNPNTDDWEWTFAPDGDFHGHRSTNARTKRWGTNRVAADTILSGENDADNNVTLQLSGSNTVTLLTQFSNPQGLQGSPCCQDSATEFEAQGIAGDSGGPVFHKRNGQWELAGVMHAVFLYPNQAAGDAIYGNATAFTDLSFSAYQTQILDYLAQDGYSGADGDINLDGIISGDGTGPWESDDVTAFIQGWMHQQSEANILSWKRGDLDQNGVTNLADFALLRNALGGTLSQGQLFSLLQIPEPSALLLAGLAALSIAGISGRARARA